MLPQKCGAAREQALVRKTSFGSNSDSFGLSGSAGNRERREDHQHVPGDDRHLALPRLTGKGVDPLVGPGRAAQIHPGGGAIDVDVVADVSRSTASGQDVGLATLVARADRAAVEARRAGLGAAPVRGQVGEPCVGEGSIEDRPGLELRAGLDVHQVDPLDVAVGAVEGTAAQQRLLLVGQNRREPPLGEEVLDPDRVSRGGAVVGIHHERYQGSTRAGREPVVPGRRGAHPGLLVRTVGGQGENESARRWSGAGTPRRDPDPRHRR